MGKIMVGTGGSQTANPALEWAAARAEHTADMVELVHVVDVTWGVVPPDFAEQALLEAEQGLRSQVRTIAEKYPTVRVHSTALLGSPVDALVDAAHDADLLVIGARRHGASGASGPRTARIATRATCSVVVVPSDLGGDGTGVVVGIDGSDDSRAAVLFAAREADRHGDPLTVVYSWTAPEPWSASDSLFWPNVPLEDDKLIVAEAVAGLAQDYPDLEVVPQVVSARPERALYAASVGARMLVLGSRGRHVLTRLLLGSVSEAIVSSLPCTVVVVRPHDDSAR